MGKHTPILMAARKFQSGSIDGPTWCSRPARPASACVVARSMLRATNRALEFAIHTRRKLCRTIFEFAGDYFSVAHESKCSVAEN
jgi:hypothetical protein